MSRVSCGKFLDRCVINSHPNPRPFGDVADPWQRQLAAAKAAALEGIAGVRDYHGPRSFLTILPRGHDKSSLEARLIAWALVYSRRKIEGYLCATDRDQAALVLKAMEDEAQLNPWWGGRLSITSKRVVGPGGSVEVVPADAASAYGFRGNLYIMDEVTHWKNDHLWTAVVSGREKVPGSLLICITNAGILGSWQDQLLRQVALKDPDEWSTFAPTGHLASWMTKDRMDKLREQIPPLQAKRVLDNIWIDPAEELGYLTVEQIRGCEDETVDPLGHYVPGAQYVASVDYGATNDRTALVVGYLDKVGRVAIARIVTIQGKPGAPVAVDDVEKWCREVHEVYRVQKFLLDPHQMEGTIQRLEKSGLPAERVSFRGGAFNTDIATNLRSLVVNRKIRWHPKQGLDFSGELASLVTKLTPTGYKFDHTSGRHDDQAFAVATMALEAVKRPFVPPAVGPLPPLSWVVTQGSSLFGRG